jgi:hypothetical protein
MSEPYAVLARRLLADAAAPRLSGPQASPGVLHNPQAGAGVRRLLMNCSLHLRPFAVVTGPGIDANTLVMLGNEPVPAGAAGSGYAAPSVSLGNFSFDASKWDGCYWCRSRGNAALGLGAFWHCTQCSGFSCSSSGTGPLRCSCGNVAAAFVTQERFEVRGAGMVAATPRQLAPSAAGPHQLPPPIAAVPRPQSIAVPRVSSVPLSGSLGPPPLRLPGRR